MEIIVLHEKPRIMEIIVLEKLTKRKRKDISSQSFPKNISIK